MTSSKLTQWINKLVAERGQDKAYYWLKRAVVFCCGMTVLLIGIAMLVLPGPAILVIPMGLAVLATEFVWAKKLLQHFKRETNKIADSIKQTFSRGKIDDNQK